MKTLLLLFAVVFVSAFMSCASSTDESADKPEVVMTNTATVAATVEAIDYQSRIVTIRGPQGNVFDIHADQNVRNLDQVRVGDQVNAEVLESVAISVQKHEGDEPAVTEASSVALAPRGEKPAVATADTVVITALVEAIDYDTRIVTLRGPQGKSRTLRVHERTQNLENVKVGDQVVVQYTVAVAITVSKPQ